MLLLSCHINLKLNKWNESHQIPLSLALQFFSLFIQNCWLHPKERKCLKYKTNESFEINTLTKQLLWEHRRLTLFNACVQSAHIIAYQDQHRALGERLLLTAEPGFSGVAAGRGVRTWPPCKVTDDMTTLTPSAVCFLSICCSASCACAQISFYLENNLKTKNEHINFYTI